MTELVTYLVNIESRLSTISCEHYIHLLQQLSDKSKEKRLNLVKKKAPVSQDNASAYKSAIAMAKIHEL